VSSSQDVFGVSRRRRRSLVEGGSWRGADACRAGTAGAVPPRFCARAKSRTLSSRSLYFFRLPRTSDGLSAFVHRTSGVLPSHLPAARYVPLFSLRPIQECLAFSFPLLFGMLCLLRLGLLLGGSLRLRPSLLKDGVNASEHRRRAQATVQVSAWRAHAGHARVKSQWAKRQQWRTGPLRA
jgi:hypothetical protein